MRHSSASIAGWTAVMTLLVAPTSFARTPGKLIHPVAAEALPRVQGEALLEARLGGLPTRRTQLVSLDFDLLSVDAARRFDPDGDTRLNLNLFPDVDLMAELTAVQVSADDRIVTWTGRVNGTRLGEVALAVIDEVASGTITTDDGQLFTLRYVGPGVHVVAELEPADMPPDGEPEEVEQTYSADAPEEVPDDGSFLDIMVLYTPSARSAAGGTSAMDTLIALGITETNQGYSNSGVAQRARLAYAAEVNYTESGSASGFSTALSQVAGQSDGYMDDIHAIRDTVGADMVSLWINNYAYCGLAYLMTTESAGFESSSFSAVHYSCATGYYSFAHEMGHNQGSHHDRAVTSSDGVFTYSHGYVQNLATPAYRTVMAYSNACSGCTRINYWSNPLVSYNGQATGVDSGSGSSADNGLSLNNTRVTAANWRDAPGCAAGESVSYTKGDFNSDGVPDVIWRNASTGQNFFWGMTGATGGNYLCHDILPTVADTNWQPVGTGDFNGDDKPDLVWRHNTNGSNAVWYMDGTTLLGSDWLPAVADTNWTIGAIEDFDQDSKPDILWRHQSTGKNVIWYMDGAAATGHDWLTTVGNLSWQIYGAGDFDLDGKNDILWRNDATGVNVIWYMDGATFLGAAYPLAVSNLAWEIVGVADYDRADAPDILWREVNTGANAIWHMGGADGATRNSYTFLDSAGTQLQIVGP